MTFTLLTRKVELFVRDTGKVILFRRRLQLQTTNNVSHSNRPKNHIDTLNLIKRHLQTRQRISPTTNKRATVNYQPYVQAGNSDISQDEQELLRTSARAVYAAVVLNATLLLGKTIAWFYTGSHSMGAEAIHSAADTLNQLIIAGSISASLQPKSEQFPYGFHPMRYIAPLTSGVTVLIFSIFPIYHAFEALFTDKPELFVSSMWSYSILGFGLVSEGTTLLIAIKAIKQAALRSKLTTRQYISRNQDPSLIVILMEDMASVVGLLIAASCMALSSYYNTHVFDACGSLMIGSLLGVVATFIIKKNAVALVGKSIPRETLNSINRVIEKDVLIRAIHDVKATDLGNGVVRYKAEVDIDGRELAKKYLENIDLKELLEDIRDIKSEKDAETFVLTHGEGVVDLLGAEVDRIEKELRVSDESFVL